MNTNWQQILLNRPLITNNRIRLTGRPLSSFRYWQMKF